MKFGLVFAAVSAMTASVALADVAELNQAHLDAIDKNNDGFLSKEEFDAFSDYAFQAMDEDKNGTLVADETRPHFAIDHFSKMDKNGDNQVTRDEFGAQMADDFSAADQDGNGQLD